MYLCLCHALTDRQVRAAIEEGGAGGTAEVYRRLGCTPRCGKCVPFVRAMVKAAHGEKGAGCGCGCTCVETAG
ncbi:MAG: (2Fe-2S)-binding protein [Magnetospirillum sp.]|nr:(2Fe-2S)-binding protein [Magnetospirillum sp.]